MELLKVKKGSHDFKPNIHPFFINRKRTRCKFRFKLLDSMWYDVNADGHPKDERGNPYKGWNKLGFGMTQGFFTNSKRSTMVAEFPSTVEGFHDIAFYINDKKGNWDAKKMIVAEANLVYSGYIDWFRHTTVMFIQCDDKPTIQAEESFYLNRSNWLPIRGLGAWHGGLYPAPLTRCFLASQVYVDQ